MKSMLSLVLIAALAPAALADPKPAPASATLKEIEQMMGFVPAFVKAIPPSLLPSWWDAAKWEMSPQTALDSKTKELIGLAVAAQIPCDYCIIVHTESARAAGASEAQIQEAVAMAGFTRQTSTMLNGMQVDRAQFRRDLDRLAHKK